MVRFNLIETDADIDSRRKQALPSIPSSPDMKFIETEFHLLSHRFAYNRFS